MARKALSVRVPEKEDAPPRAEMPQGDQPTAIARPADDLTEDEIRVLREMIGATLGDDEPRSATARVGLSVLYKLTVHDVAQIIASRKNRAERGAEPLVGVDHAAVIVAVSSPDIASLIVFLDGQDQLWVRHRPRGERPGNWRPDVSRA